MSRWGFVVSAAKNRLSGSKATYAARIQHMDAVRGEALYRPIFGAPEFYYYALAGGIQRIASAIVTIPSHDRKLREISPSYMLIFGGLRGKFR